MCLDYSSGSRTGHEALVTVERAERVPVDRLQVRPFWGMLWAA